MKFLNRLRSDLRFLRGVWHVIRLTSPIARNPTLIFPLLVDELAARHGDKCALISDRERLTYQMLAARSCRYARWAMAQGIRKGDVVGLFMTNRPEYVAIWLGIIRAGGTVALLNTNLTGPALAFCIDSVAPKHVIVAADLADTLSSSDSHRKTVSCIWLHGETAPAHSQLRLDEAVLAFDGAPLSAAERPELTVEDGALFIFTSGTTGLPKAANINHFGLMLAANAFAGVMNTGPG